MERGGVRAVSHSTASRTGATALAGDAEVGASRIKAAFAIVGVVTVEIAVLLATALVGLLLDASWALARLDGAGIGWPFGTLLAAAGAVLTVGAVWRGWDLVSVRLLVVAALVWSTAGTWILASGGTASVLVFAGVALALVATVLWSRRRSGSPLQ
jgi:hypothetical protein